MPEKDRVLDTRMTTETDQKKRRWMAAGLAGFSAALAMLLYWRVLGLPLYHDDIAYMWVSTRFTIVEIFTLGEVIQWYRPLNHLMWKIPLLLGTDTALTMHILCLVFLIANGWLTGLLARRLAPERPLVPWLATAIFVVFPFNYQSIPWASSLGHPMVAFGTLIGMLFAERWWASRRWVDLLLVWLGIFIASFSHENGVVSGGILLGWLLIGKIELSPKRLAEEWRRIALVVLPALFINGVYAKIWLGVPKFYDTEVAFQFQELIYNLAFLLQGIAYPVAQAGGWLVGRGLSPLASALILDAVGLALLIILILVGRGRGAWQGVWWYAVAIAPAALFLPWWTYVIHGHRLMLTASVGAALAWALAIGALWERLKGAARIVPAAVAGLLVIGGGWFVNAQMCLHDQLAPLYRDLYAFTPGEESSAIFNLPNWISYRQRVYALGNEGINYVTEYIDFSQMIWMNTGQQPDAHIYLWHEINADRPEYWFGLLEPEESGPEARIAIAQNTDRVYRVKLVGDHWGWEVGGPAEGVSFDDAIVFANGVRLVPSAWLEPGSGQVELSMAWEVPQPVEEIAFVHLICGDAILSQADGPPLGGIYPFLAWQPGERWGETRLLPLPEGTDPACLGVRIGLYHPVTGERSPLTNGDEWIVIPVERR